MVKVVFNDVKKGKSYQKEFELDIFSGKKIGSKVQGDSLGLKDYEFLITGGSDSAGFPLNKSFDSSVRKKILIDKKGTKVRKNVRGNQFGSYMSQISLKVVKYGSVDLMKGLGVSEKAKEEKPAEKKQVLVEQPKEVKKEEKPKPKEKPKEEKVVEKPKVEEKKE